MLIFIEYLYVIINDLWFKYVKKVFLNNLEKFFYSYLILKIKWVINF